MRSQQADRATAVSHGHLLNQMIPKWVWVLLPFAVVGLGVAAFVIFQPITVLPRIAPAPGFNLVNGQGERVSNEDLRGRVTLYSFSAVACGAACGQSVEQIAAVRAGLNGRLATPLQLVTISLDAQPDSPQALPDDGLVQWQWLTGSAVRVRAAVGGGFDLFYAVQPDGDVKFRPRYVLVDANGMIRARYFAAVPDTELLLRDIDYLMREAMNSQGAKTLAYEAAHLFLCYPR